jgi:GxxExxY protein
LNGLDEEVLSAKGTRKEREKMREDLLLKDEVYAVVGAAMEVYRTLSVGFLEAVYQEAMEIELGIRQIPFETQKKLQLFYKQRLMKKRYCADSICYGSVLVEIKAIDQLTTRDEAQLLNYLKATGLQIGVLINFGSHAKILWKRMILRQEREIAPDDSSD